MKTKGITWVVVGADCIAANGDVASKIGTYQLAVSAMHHGVRFMVVAPSTSIDLNLATGEDIPLEERDADECWSRRAPAGGMSRPSTRCSM
jgi:methylthioribose-1-phosphate isomerase